MHSPRRATFMLPFGYLATTNRAHVKQHFLTDGFSLMAFLLRLRRASRSYFLRRFRSRASRSGFLPCADLLALRTPRFL